MDNPLNKNNLKNDISEYQKLINYSYTLLSVSRTRKEIEKKLEYYCSKFELDASLCVKVITRLVDENLLDDVEYSLRYVEQQFRSKTPKSPLEVKSFLYRKGISPEDISIALEHYDEPHEIKAIQRVISKKKQKSPDLYKYLLKKGFKPALISKFDIK